MSNKSAIYDYIHGLGVRDTGDGYVLKVASAREVISRLPSPTNAKRNIGLIPDVEVAFQLSTSKELPAHVVRKIGQSENSEYYSNTSKNFRYILL